MLCGITQFLAAVLQVSEVFRHLWNAYAISQVSALASLVTSPLLPPFAMESKSRVELHAAFSVLIASIRLLFTAPTSFDPYATSFDVLGHVLTGVDTYALLGGGIGHRVPRGGGRHPRGHLRGDLHLLEAVGPAHKE